MKRFILHDDRIRHNCLTYIQGLGLDTPQQVTITDYVPKRSLDQNAFFHAVPLKLLCEHTGFEQAEMKDYLLGEAFGWKDGTMFDRKVSLPLRRSSSLNTKEFSWFIEWVEQWAMQTLGVAIPRPNEW